MIDPAGAVVRLCPRCEGEPHLPGQRWGRRCLTAAQQSYEAWQQEEMAWPQQERMPKDFMAW